jgi:hypothetical protein
MCEWEKPHYHCPCPPTYRKTYECEENKSKGSRKDKEPGMPKYDPTYRWHFNYECRKCDPCHPDDQRTV